MSNNQIVYQDSFFCLSCWHHQLPSAQHQKSTEYVIRNIKEIKEKKISLKKPHKHSSRPNSEQLELLKTSAIPSASPQSHRDTQSAQKEQLVRFSYQTEGKRPTASICLDPPVKAQEIRPHSQPGTDQQPYKVIENDPKNPVLRNLKGTIKVSQAGIESNEELIKTKKTNPFGKSSVFQFKNLKASVYSINEGQIRERMQESQIVLDFFNPGERKLQQLQRVIGKQSIREEQSFTLSP